MSIIALILAINFQSSSIIWLDYCLIAAAAASNELFPKIYTFACNLLDVFQYLTIIGLIYANYINKFIKEIANNNANGITDATINPARQFPINSTNIKITIKAPSIKFFLCWWCIDLRKKWLSNSWSFKKISRPISKRKKFTFWQ